MEHIWPTLQRRFVLGVPATRWAAFLALTAGLVLVLGIGLGIVRGRLVKRAARSGGTFDAYLALLLGRTWMLTLLAGSAFVALQLVELRPPAATGGAPVERTVRIVAMLVLFLQVGRWGTGLIDAALERGFRFVKFSQATARTASGVVRSFALAALWLGVAIMVLGTLGVEVTPLLAGLGVGGIAVGFALQRILGDVFCSVAIVLDRPFEVGDLIQAGESTGTVERIGVRTTRVRSLGGEQIIFPNSDLLQSRIRNFNRMAERRVAFRLGVDPGTPSATLERIPGLVRAIVEGIEGARFDRAHFTAFGESGATFDVVYFVLDPDPNRAMDIQQRINLELLRSPDGLNVRLIGG